MVSFNPISSVRVGGGGNAAGLIRSGLNHSIVAQFDSLALKAHPALAVAGPQGGIEMPEASTPVETGDGAHYHRSGEEGRSGTVYGLPQDRRAGAVGVSASSPCEEAPSLKLTTTPPLPLPGGKEIVSDVHLTLDWAAFGEGLARGRR